VATEFDLNIIGIYLDEHPWDESQNWAEVKPLFQTPFVDVLMIQPLYWGVTALRCGDGYREVIPAGNTMCEYPTGLADWCPDEECADRHQNIYEGLYKYHGDEDIQIVVTSSENDWDIFGNGCRAIDECNLWPGYWALAACENGTGVFEDKMYNGAVDEDGNVDCYTVACNQLRWDRIHWMRKRLTDRQRAAEWARYKYRDKPLRVWHNVEINFTGTRDWQFVTIVKDVLPYIPEVDSVSISMYRMSGGPEHAIRYVMEHTGLPAHRIFIGEVGNEKHEDQYDRIFNWVDTAFRMGVRMAFVWDLEYNPDTNSSDWTVVDRETWEWFPGMHAIYDLNVKWRSR
jgi:hypothetical protein